MSLLVRFLKRTCIIYTYALPISLLTYNLILKLIYEGYIEYPLCKSVVGFHGKLFPVPKLQYTWGTDKYEESDFLATKPFDCYNLDNTCKENSDYYFLDKESKMLDKLLLGINLLI